MMLLKEIHPVIDDMITKGNYAIYYGGNGMSGHVGRKFCFYRVLIFFAESAI